MDYKKLSAIGVVKVTDSKKQEILQKIKERRNQARVTDSKSYRKFRVSDAFKNLKKKIKDELEETESTAEAIEVAMDQISPEVPAEQVVAAVVEVLAETIDGLEEAVGGEDADELTGEEIDEIVEPVEDSLQKRRVKARLKGLCRKK